MGPGAAPETCRREMRGSGQTAHRKQGKRLEPQDGGDAASPRGVCTLPGLMGAGEPLTCRLRGEVGGGPEGRGQEPLGWPGRRAVGREGLEGRRVHRHQRRRWPGWPAQPRVQTSFL